MLVLVVGSSGSSPGIAMPPYNQCPVKPSLGLAALLGVGLILSVRLAADKPSPSL